jgi:hypothetical protein
MQNDYQPSYKENKNLPDVYFQSYKWYRQAAGWILREEWFTTEPKLTLLAFRERFYDRRYDD